MIDSSKSILEVAKVLNGESIFFIKTADDLNVGIDHLFRLINDSYILYQNKSFASSVFLAIAVIEEVAKIHMALFVKGTNTYVKKDKLRDHKSKEMIGVNYSICMGTRIKETLGDERLEKLYNLAYSGKLKELREKSIYCERCDGAVVTPYDIITQDFSKSILLFAIESFDDNLVGLTTHSMDVSIKTDTLFESLSNS